MPKISIIVPVYNTEQYLRQCLDSIISQTFKDFECICVNDGSTDNSLSILQEYANKDNRIKIISQKNSGLSSVRNVGIKNSSGVYVTSIDSDDFVSENYIEKLYACALKHNCDLVYCRHKLYYNVDNIFVSSDNETKVFKLIDKIKKCEDKKIILEDLFFIVENARSFCMKLYKSDVIRQNNISFFEDIMAQQDYVFNILFALYSLNNIDFVDEQLYCYRKQIKSITSNKDKMALNGLNSFIRLTENLEQRNLLQNNKILRKFVYEGFIYRLGKKISYQQQKIIFLSVFKHMQHLKNDVCKNDLFIKMKLNLFLFLMKILKFRSFLLFRILKNF